MSSSSKSGRNIGVLARPLRIEGVGADNVLPPEASIVGAKLFIPEWEAPSQTTGKSDLLEVWVVAPGSPVEIPFHREPFPVPVNFPDFVLLPPEYLQIEGDIRLRYRVTAGDDENEDTSSPQVFIVKRPTPVNLAEPDFPSATLWGYLNCSSQPKLWESIFVHVPAQPGRFAKDDECVLDWEGFTTLNGRDPIPGTALRLTKLLTQEEATSTQGFDFVLGSDKYEQYIKPMERNASALARYTLYRNGGALGKSPPGLVKIDRIIPGEALSCGPGSVAGLGSATGSASAFHDVGDSMNQSSMESKNMNMKVKSGGGVLAESPVIIGQLADGRLTYQQLKVDKLIKVRLPNIDDKVKGGARIELKVFPRGALPDPQPYDPAYLVAVKERNNQPGDVWTFPIEFDVPTDTLVDVNHLNGDYAPYEMAFILEDDDGNVDSSDTYTDVLVDLTAPYQRQPGPGNGEGTPRPTAVIPVVTTIDDAWLADPANTNGLDIVIPHAYTKFEAGNDSVNFYISKATTFKLMQAETPAFSDPLLATGIINIPLTFLEGLDDGTYYYSYNLTDLPGNISNHAAVTFFFNRVKAPAPILGVPRIPVTNGGVPITFSTVAPPGTRAIMEIDPPLHALGGDQIIPYINSTERGTTALPEQVIPTPPTTATLTFDLDYGTLAPFFGDENKPDETEIEYWYELYRATISPNPVSAPMQYAIIDFSYAGPENPNLPDPDNINITPVVVQGAGNQPPPPNTLGPDQAGMDAAMNWPLWTDPNRPVTGREIVKFYYQGKQVGGPVPVVVGATTVTTQLPWTTIRDEGNGTVASGDAREAYITIEYPGSENVMKQTPTTKVDVTAIVIDLPKPQIVVSAYKGATGSTVPERIVTMINCPSLNHPTTAGGPMPPYMPRNLRIRIQRDRNIPSGAAVTLEFEGRTTNAGDASPIPNTLITDSGTMPVTGDLEFRLTDYDKIREIQLPSPGPEQRPAMRYARIAYTVNGIESAVTLPVSLLNSSLVYCEQERPEVP
ncbi:hypothetical protein [Pseudomonas brassicacearum]|uniref:hypothetical protein n=1 Tax=Pseudomonas brassicacearum TaxID=930166 RepID=UPI001DF6FE77|nr:hypothetical protein [Pseudomonas brassicacearum]CAH0270435.1 hypothetical protein SRABI06_03654 [Pseudomonas brassicacearum]